VEEVVVQVLGSGRERSTGYTPVERAGVDLLGEVVDVLVEVTPKQRVRQLSLELVL
jgi:hypothetical protein